jgi:hypothetical protein
MWGVLGREQRSPWKPNPDTHILVINVGVEEYFLLEPFLCCRDREQPRNLMPVTLRRYIYHTTRHSCYKSGLLLEATDLHIEMILMCCIYHQMKDSHRMCKLETNLPSHAILMHGIHQTSTKVRGFESHTSQTHFLSPRTKWAEIYFFFTSFRFDLWYSSAHWVRDCNTQ